MTATATTLQSEAKIKVKFVFKQTSCKKKKKEKNKENKEKNCFVRGKGRVEDLQQIFIWHSINDLSRWVAVKMLQ